MQPGFKQHFGSAWIPGSANSRCSITARSAPKFCRRTDAQSSGFCVGLWLATKQPFAEGVPTAFGACSFVGVSVRFTDATSLCGMHIPMQFPQIALFQQARRVNDIKTSTFTHGGHLAKSDFSLSVQFEKFTTFILV